MKKMRLYLKNNPGFDLEEYGVCGIPSQYLGLRTGDTVHVVGSCFDGEYAVVTYDNEAIHINGFGLSHSVDDFLVNGLILTPMRKFEDIPAGTVIDNDVEYYEED